MPRGETSIALNSTDFGLGVLNAASEERLPLYLWAGDTKLDRGFAEAYEDLRAMIESGQVDIDLEFTINPERFHGDSVTVFKMMQSLCSVGYLVHVGRNLYRFDRGDKAADELFAQIPGDPATYRRLGAGFLSVIES